VIPLQRYEPHMYSSLLGESRVLFEASDTGDWVKEDEAIEIEIENRALFENNKELYAAGLAMRVKNKRLRAALRVISDFDCDCFEDDSCPACLARLALEEPT